MFWPLYLEWIYSGRCLPTGLHSTQMQTITFMKTDSLSIAEHHRRPFDLSQRHWRRVRQYYCTNIDLFVSWCVRRFATSKRFSTMLTLLGLHVVQWAACGLSLLSILWVDLDDRLYKLVVQNLIYCYKNVRLTTTANIGASPINHVQCAQTILQNDHPASRNTPQMAQVKQKIALVCSRGLTLACPGLFHDTKPCLMCDSLKLKYRWCAVIDVTTSQNRLRLKILSDYLVPISMHLMYPD